VANKKPAKVIDQERAKADALFSSIGDGAIATDERGVIQRVNQVALDLLGYSETELLNSWYPKAIAATDGRGNSVDVMDRPISEAFFTGQPVSSKIYYRRKDGLELPLASTVSPILLDGKPIGAIEVFRDISLEMAVDKMKSEFIGLASHQLRTPLSAISVYAHLLQDGYAGPLNDQQMDYVATTVNATSRMQALINALLNISRIESGQLAFNPELLWLPDIIKDVLSDQLQAIKEKKLRIIKRLPRKKVLVTTDCLMAKEVLANLLANAVQYTPTGGSITVAVKMAASEIVASITDTGIGIPASKRSRLFSPFYRAENALEYFHAGTGLGLYLVKLLVQVLGGRVWFTSKEGHGSTFFVAFPIDKDASD
jgi:two-component system, OmpR family, sensor histidine kinase VicK